MTVTVSPRSSASSRVREYVQDPDDGTWADPDGVRVGAQLPRIESWPAHTGESYARAAMGLMELVGKPLAPWQQHVLTHACGTRGDGKFAAFEVCVLASRQNGKNVCIEARELLSLFVLPDKQIIHSAHQFGTARKSFRELELLIRNTPALFKKVDGWRPGLHPRAKVRGIRTNGAEMSITLGDGSRIEYKARAGGQGRGFTGDLVVLDEAFDLDAEDVADMLPTMAARSMEGSPQVWYTSSAGKPNSATLHDLRARGLSGDAGRLAYFEWSAVEGSASDDVDAWYQANPMLGIYISEEYVADELDSMRADSENADVAAEQFRRERLGLYPALGTGDAIPSDAWARCLDVDSEPGGQVFMALDVPPARDVATIAVVSERPDGRVHVEVADQVYMDLAAARMKAIIDKWAPRAVVIDAGGAAASVVEQLRAMGVRTRSLSLNDYAKASGEVFDAIQSGDLAHMGQDALDAAVEAADTKVRGQSLWTWVRSKHATASISPLVAVTHAWYGYRRKNRPAVPDGVVVAPRRSGWRVTSL